MTDEARNLSARWKVLEHLGMEITGLAKMAHEDSSTNQLIDIMRHVGDSVKQAEIQLDEFRNHGFDIRI